LVATLDTRFDEQYPEFSPDGRWLVYTSDESGQDEVYVRPYPGPGRAIQISTRGGSNPCWSRDGAEIFYIDLDAEWLHVVPVDSSGDDLRPGSPMRLFDWNYQGFFPIRRWDIAPDGRFLLAKDTDPDQFKAQFLDNFNPDRIHIVLNWHEELKRKMAEAE